MREMAGKSEEALWQLKKKKAKVSYKNGISKQTISIIINHSNIVSMLP